MVIERSSSDVGKGKNKKDNSKGGIRQQLSPMEAPHTLAMSFDDFQSLITRQTFWTKISRDNGEDKALETALLKHAFYGTLIVDDTDMMGEGFWGRVSARVSVRVWGRVWGRDWGRV